MHPRVEKGGEVSRKNKRHLPKTSHLIPKRTHLITHDKVVRERFTRRAARGRNVLNTRHNVKTMQTVPKRQSLLKKQPNEILDLKMRWDSPYHLRNRNNRKVTHEQGSERFARVMTRSHRGPNQSITNQIIQDNPIQSGHKVIPNISFPI